MTIDFGERRQRQAPTKKSDPYRHNCAYRYPDETRCPMPGTWSTSTTGETKAWWCRYHDPNSPMRLGRDWTEERRILAEEAGVGREPSKIEAELQRRIDMHPEWQRQPGEGQRAYASRMLAECKRLAAGVGKPMPGTEKAR